MSTDIDLEDPLGLDSTTCDVCGHEGPDVELYETIVPMVGSFDMPMCPKCARLGTSTGDSS